jgi:hypothetical protein
MAAEAPARGGGLQRLVLWLLIFALLAVVWWLASERNVRHYALSVQNGQLVVERGRFFPMGTAPVRGVEPYIPIPVPAGAKSPAYSEYDDSTALDRALLDVLTGWAREAAKKGEPSSMQTASQLVERASHLPGLTAAQLAEVAALRGELAWEEARGDLTQAAQSAGAALRKLEMVEKANGPHASEAAAQAQKVRALEQGLRELTRPAGAGPSK